MSRSVKSLCPYHSTLVTTGQLFWWMATVLSIIQLVDSEAFDNDYFDSGPHNDPLQQDWSRDRRDHDDDGTISVLKFKNADFEITYDVANDENLPKGERNIPPIPRFGKDDVAETIRTIFPPPDEVVTRFHRNAGRFGPRERSTVLAGKPNVPDKCKDDVICDEAVEYPEDVIDRAISNAEVFQNLAHVDELPADGGWQDVSENTLCQSTRMRVFLPKTVRKELHDDWIHVANTKNFKQGFLASTCQNIDDSCTEHFENLRAGYKAVCRQHYNYRGLVVINVTDTKPYISTFRVPAGCCCYRKTYDGYRMAQNSVDRV